ncbi:hypothetical protein Vafri_2961 [Volvox africanus]|uniref:Uncharacterized protein n=1 Tax=Volvox africanus TaxID=51714 RepID=A0A8J4AS67_9CHLO|nr:hypothetical protein Vafri_2961 [Volvox africanus]
MSVRGKEFPSLVQEAGHGYKLRLLVRGPDGRERSVYIPPPHDIVTDDTDVWPLWCFQMLLVASEYVAALHEFMTWSFPDEWAPRKAQVAGYARQLIRNSSPVPQPPLWKQQQQQQQDEDEDGSAYCVWAAFTHCYFHGLRKPADGNRASTPPSPGEHSEASRWLHRLVGDRGWQEEGPVHSAAARWVGATLLRLQPLFPDVAAMSAGEWAARSEQQRGVAAALRSVATRGDKNVQGRYVPVYPYRMTGTWSENRFKLTLKGQAGPRSVKGSCGVPPNFGQTSNCALGYLVLADVTEAFTAAFEEHLVTSTSAATFAAAGGVAAEVEVGVTSGLSNMSLDGPMAPFGDETLRLIVEDVGRIEPEGPPPPPLTNAAPVSAGKGRGAEGAAVGAHGNGPDGVPEAGCFPGALGGNVHLPHLSETLPGNVLVPTRTVTTALQGPKQYVPPTPAPPPRTPPNQPAVAATAAVGHIGSAAGTKVAAPRGSDDDDDRDGDGDGGAGVDEAAVIRRLLSSVAALREVLDSYPHGVVRPARLMRLHREVAAALEAYHHHQQWEHLPPLQQQQQQQQQQQAPTPIVTLAATPTAAIALGGRFHFPVGGCTNPVTPTSTPLPGFIPGPFGGSLFVPSPGLLTPEPFGGGRGGLAIPYLTPGPFGAVAAAATAAASATTAETPAREQSQQQPFVSSRPGPGRGDLVDHDPSLGGHRATHVTASPLSAVGCTRLRDDKDFLVINVTQEVQQGAGTAAEKTWESKGQAVLDTRGAKDLHSGNDSDGGGCTAGTGSGYGDVGVGCGSQTDSLKMISLVGPVEGDSSILEFGPELELGLGLGPGCSNAPGGGGSSAGGCGGGGGGGDASGMSWSRGGGTSADSFLSPS